MLRGVRQWAQTFIYLDWLFALAWLAAGAVLGLLALTVVLGRGEYRQVPAILVPVLAVVLLFAFVRWVSRDARQASKRLRAERGQAKPRPDGDMSDVAGLPSRPPWMG
jgi:hypothetical protein